MKRFVCLSFLMIGCASNAQTPVKPNGEEVFLSLLNAAGRALTEEPLCNMQSVSSPQQPFTLGHHLSTVLATSYESSNTTKIQTNCNLSKTEQPNGIPIDIWDCQVISNEISVSGEFISSSTIAFGLRISDLKFVPMSLRCF